jgi:uncharacterized damage-inducible protein DinB
MKTTSGTARTPDQEFLEASRIFLATDLMPRVLHCVHEMSESDLWWRPNEASNSVGNLVIHLAGNLRQWILEGLGEIPSHRDRDAEFTVRGPVPKDELIAILQSAVNEVVSLLQGFDASRLLERRHVQIYDVSALQAVYHVVEHFSYHVGQIVYIYKLRTGADPNFYAVLSKGPQKAL